MLPASCTFGVRLLVQVEHGAHLSDLTAASTGDAAVVADHEVGEVSVEGFGLWQQKAQAQLQKTLWLQVSQPKGSGHDVFQLPVRSLFLIGFRQIQIVLPDILQKGERQQRGGGAGWKGEIKGFLSLSERQKQFLSFD